VKKILSDLGLTPGEAVNTFFARVETTRGLPYPMTQEGYSFAADEYGLSHKEIDRADAAMRRKIERARRSGRLSK
jgi:antitoxin component of RelBE/YafQ-DinJ toxin-antitoxin module